MLRLREGTSRRHTDLSGLETWMTFDSEDRQDRFCDGFRSLQVFNEKSLAPGRSIPARSRQNLETLTYVLDGTLLHEDDGGHTGVIRSGEFQHMSAGSGMRHQRLNGSQVDHAHVFEGRLRSDSKGKTPDCVQKRFSAADRKGVFCLIASPDELRSSFHLRQDIRVYSSLPDRGCHLIHELKPGRQAWLHVVRGRIQLHDLSLIAGDGVAYLDEISVSVTALEPSELLLFDLA
ncbi:MAG TPA: pirin family protein [Planctomycetota bacterium]|nr:pirin family protein [Planctomycetota bacterium]